jgi:hypothetical protein
MVGCFHNRRAFQRILRTFTRTHLVVFACIFLCHSFLGPPALAQLRTGRSSRPLYAEELQASRQPAAKNRTQPTSGAPSTRSARSVVERANYIQEVVEEDSVDEIMAEDSVFSQEGFGEEVVTDYANEYEYSLGNLGGCGDPHCTSCDGYSDIAPTCASLACKPLGSTLWGVWCRTKVRAEIPLFWRRAQGPPPLVTTAPPGTDPDLAGQLGQDSTTVLLGDGTLGQDANAGLRLTFDTRLDRNDRYGLLFRYWNAGDQDDTYNFSSSQFPILARPFLNTTNTPSEQDTQLVAFPGDSVGNVAVATSSTLYGLEVSLKKLLYEDRFTRVHWLSGYQHITLDEGIVISSNTNVTGDVPGLQGASIAVTDNFQTENNFDGVAYGIMSSRQFACWKMETMFRLGMGNLSRRVNISGSTTTTSGGVSNTQSQGLLARNTNSQPFKSNTFVVVPEVGINFAYRLRPGLDFNFGYNYMLVPKVAQASQQIDDNLAVNLSDPLVGALDPQLNFDERKYWINSLGLGLQLRY